MFQRSLYGKRVILKYLESRNGSFVEIIVGHNNNRLLKLN